MRWRIAIVMVYCQRIWTRKLGPLGKFPADIFHGWLDLNRDAVVAKLGGSILARLVVVFKPRGDPEPR